MVIRDARKRGPLGLTSTSLLLMHPGEWLARRNHTVSCCGHCSLSPLSVLLSTLSFLLFPLSSCLLSFLSAVLSAFCFLLFVLCSLLSVLCSLSLCSLVSALCSLLFTFYSLLSNTHCFRLGDHPKNWRATNPKTGGRPTPKLAAGEWSSRVRVCAASFRHWNGRPTRGLAGDQPENWRATNPRTGGRPNPRTGSR